MADKKEGVKEPVKVCDECKRREATTTYSDLKVCEQCSDKLNDYFDEEYR